MTAVVVVDAAVSAAAAAEHVLHELEARHGDVHLASTHAVGGRVVLALRWSGGSRPLAADLLAELAVPEDGAVVVQSHDGGPADSAGSRAGVVRADQALRMHRAQVSGRVVRFAGRELIERETTVGGVLAGSAVDEVRALAGTELDDDSVVDLGEWARPTWQQGRLVLQVQRSARGLVPFESRTQHACCHDHA